MYMCSLLSFAQFSGSGSGTENDPYLIFNEAQLAQVSNFLNQEVVFKLMKDLDLTNWIEENNPRQGWVPIGVESEPFSGIFHGNNHKITGLMIQRTSTDNVGFFGYVSGATIENLTIEGGSVLGASNVGGFIGYAKGSEIINCNLSLSSGVEGTSNVGGFMGQSLSSDFSSFNVETSVTAQDYLGGFIGLAEGGSFQQGRVKGQRTCTGDYAGGFAGKMTSVLLADIQQSGDIVAQDYTGGFVGCCSSGTFERCTVESNVQGEQYVSGFAGALESTTSSFNTCFHKGTITATGDYAGGIVGVSKGRCIDEIESCNHFGDMQGINYVGGLIGAVLNLSKEPTLYKYYWKTDKYYYVATDIMKSGNQQYVRINNCYSIGNIIGYSYIGGLIGYEMTVKSFSCRQDKTSGGGYNYVYADNHYSEVTFSSTYNIYTRNTAEFFLINNYYSGTIQGIDNVGGLVGYKKGGTIQFNYANTNIYGSNNVGGIVGQIDGDIQNGYSDNTTLKSNVSIASTVSATTQNVGRIYGIAAKTYATIGALGSSESNRALAQTRVVLSGVAQDIDDDLQNGTSIGPSALKLKANYVAWGWNFDDNWNILETESFPYKKYQAAPPVIESSLVSQATSISGKSIDGGTVYLYYKTREAVSTESRNYKWFFDTEALQSGALVQIYADVEGMAPSYLTTASVGYPGSGTTNDPWRIYTAEDLQGVSNRGYYKVMNDIDLTQWINENSPEKGWEPIGRNSGDATYIDGNGYTISGLWIDNTENFNGLFSNFSAGQIKNLKVEVAEGKSVKGGDYTGILIGRIANGSIENCSVKGEVAGTVHVGGVAGYAEQMNVKSIHYEGKVTSECEDAYVGGLVGMATDCTLARCESNTTLSSSGNGCSVGGLIGYAQHGSIDKSIANVSLTETGENCFSGGLVGYDAAPITLSYTTGNVMVTGDNSYTGGLVGYALSPIDNCYSTVELKGSLFTAGLVGYTFSSIDKCYAQGNIYGVKYGAGVVGELDGVDARLTNSVAANNILSLTDQSSWGCRVIGGYKNGAADPDLSNYALSTMQVSLNNVPQKKTDDLVEGIAKSEAELNQQSTYASLGWDFNNVWIIDNGYPVLKWTTEPDFIPGDANGDGKVNGTDIVVIANMVLGRKDKNGAADANQDGKVNGTDIVVVANIVLGRSSAPFRKAPVVTASGSATLSIEPFDITAGSEATMTVDLNNADDVITLVQFDLTLPKGLSIKTVGGDFDIDMAGRTTWRKHSLDANLNDGYYTFLLKSDSNTPIDGTSGGIITVTLVADATFTGGKIVIDNTVLTTPEEVEINPARYEYSLGGDEPTPVPDGTCLSIEPFSITAGSEATMTIDLNNADDVITLVQFDLTLPQGLSIKTMGGDFDIDMAGRTTWRKHSLDANLNDGYYTFLLKSDSNTPIDGTSGGIITITLVADASFDSGKIVIDNTVLTTPDEVEINPACYEYEITVPTALPTLKIDRTQPHFIYNLQGQRLSVLQKGINIIDGKKVMVK